MRRPASPPNRVYRSAAENRRRSLAIGIATTSVLVCLLVAVVWYVRSQPPTPGTVRVYDAATGKKLWSRSTDGGVVVVLAVTPGGALVADADDCIHGGMGAVELLTPRKTTFVSAVPGCAVYRFTESDGVYAHRAGGELVVTIPAKLGGGTASLPCPCPESRPGPNGQSGSPVNRGAYTRVRVGTFVVGAD